MKHSPEVWKLALNSLEAGVPVAILYVVESLGSSPGRAGFAMSVTSDQTAGSVGGGPMELRLIARARDGLAGSSYILLRQVHEADAADPSGMICSGEQTVWIHTLQSDDLPLILSLSQNSRGVLRLDTQGWSFHPGESRSVRHSYSTTPLWTYEEDWGRRDHLHIVGAGHCSLALSKVCADLDFEVSVYDDRRDLPTLEANVWAHHRISVPNYSSIGESIPEGGLSYVCVMTFGYKTDAVALRSLLNRDYRFLGALGSRAKVDQLLAAFEAEGFAPERLRRLAAPLGLPIHSQTPAEIAVSVAAQLIRVRNEPSRKTA